MKQLLTLLKILADGHFHSGEILAQQLGLSRSGIWKTIKKIEEEFGVIIHAVSGRGYKLESPIEFLDSDLIQQPLSNEAQAGIDNLELYSSLDSTNRYLYQLAGKGIKQRYAVFAEHQTQGQGRRGRQWQSPFAQNLYFSILWHFDFGPEKLAGLSLAIAVAIARALQLETGIQPQLKWPNDVWHTGKKLSGNLLEIQGQSSGPCSVVIGIGVNVDMDDKVTQSIDQPWTDLHRACHQPVDRNSLSAALLNQLVPALTQFAQTGLETFMPDWSAWDLTYGRNVDLIFADHAISGKSMGIDQQGALLLDNEQGVRAYQMGEVSLRPQAQS
ncbi:MAG: bifunctional biotin--[acetyl-CoA-carboxylase] ligase/biotin operon repressor BirA [Gammaproteobacteria bacterium]|nr:bifunctional biotin--[acetyl-CoA-carboxylase] ligase/biotin operon repressor BirA [Gammaproteobacteria bacterium]